MRSYNQTCRLWMLDLYMYLYVYSVYSRIGYIHSSRNSIHYFFSDNDAPHSARLDGMPRGQCRLVSVNEPTDAVASRDLGGAVAVELPGATGGATHGV